MPLNLEPVQSGYNLSVINENFQRIEDTWDEKLDRLVSTQPNYMEQELDMNSNHIINHPAPRNELDLLRLKDIQDLVIGSDVQGVLPILQERQLGDGVTKIFNTPAVKPAAPQSFIINLDGVTQRPGTDYSNDVVGEVRFVDAPEAGVVIDITYYEPFVIEFEVNQSNVRNTLFTSDGVTLVYDLTVDPLASETVFVFIDGIKQRPNVDYTVSGTFLSFTSVPPASSEIDITVFLPTEEVV